MMGADRSCILPSVDFEACRFRARSSERHEGRAISVLKRCRQMQADASKRAQSV